MVCGILGTFGKPRENVGLKVISGNFMAACDLKTNFAWNLPFYIKNIIKRYNLCMFSISFDANVNIFTFM